MNNKMKVCCLQDSRGLCFTSSLIISINDIVFYILFCSLRTLEVGHVPCETMIQNEEVTVGRPQDRHMGILVTIRIMF